MSVLFYVFGVVCVLGGAAALVFGVPVKEFSFGDTLIVSGTIGVVGGLILIGLGAAIAQLQRIAELLGARPLSRAGQPLDTGVRLGAAAGRVPFPPRPKTEPRERPVDMPVMPRPPGKDGESELGLSPSLRNPDMPLMAAEEAEQLPLSPREEEMPRAGGTPASATPQEPPEQEPSWRPPPSRPSQSNYFEKMWPAERSVPSSTPEDEHAPTSPESVERAPSVPDENEPIADQPHDDVQPVAVLKSGVVDGMGYTLYVDGSIEAELPDGTLRFASINELRTHLEKGS